MAYITVRYFCWNKVTKIRSPGAGFRILKQKKMDSLKGAETKTLPEHKVIQGLAQTGATLYQAKYSSFGLFSIFAQTKKIYLR